MLSPYVVAYDDPPATDDPPPAKTYSQEEFDTHMAGMRRKYDAQVTELRDAQKQLAEQLESAKKAKGLTDDERSALTQQIQDLESKYLTDQEKAERKAAKQQQELTSQIEGLTARATNFESLWQKSVTTNEIYSAATAGENKAIDPDQIDALLRSHHEIAFVEDEVDGEPNGRLVPRVKFNDVDKDGKPVQMTYSIQEAVDRMRELPRYANQFADSLKGGLGGGKNAGSGKLDPNSVLRNPSEFRRLNKENPERLNQLYDRARGV